LEKQLPLRSQRYWALPTKDYQASKVYVGAPYGCLYLNVVGREPNGLVPPGGRGEVLTHLVAELSNIVDPDTGEPLFSHIYEREHLYSNPAIGQPPDLIVDFYSSRWGLSWQVPPPVVSRDGYFVKGTGVVHGEHSREGIFVFAGRDVTVDPRRGSASLLDVPATLLHLYSVPIPDDYDGRVLVELLESDFLSAQPVCSQPGDSVGMLPSISGYAQAEAEDILLHLRGLGYVE
jgi:predicted AlkP superfamily phosphohydrolase/phosphomutase